MEQEAAGDMGGQSGRQIILRFGRRVGLWKSWQGAKELLRRGWLDSGMELLTVRKEGCTQTGGQCGTLLAASESSGSVCRGGWAFRELNILILRRPRPDVLKVTGPPSILLQETQEAGESRCCSPHPGAASHPHTFHLTGM